MGSPRPAGEDKDESLQTEKKTLCSSGTCVIQQRVDVSRRDDEERTMRQEENQTDEREGIRRHVKEGFKGKGPELLRLRERK